MKKIIIISLSLLILTSCGGEKQENIKEAKTNNSTWINKVQEKNIDNNIDEEEIKTFSKVENSFKKLKNIEISEEDLQLLDETVNSIYNSNIINKATESNDTNLCSKLEENYKNNCVNNVILSSKDEKQCEILSKTGAINNCKNGIRQDIAYEKLDEKLCDEMIDESNDKSEINSCKNRILEEKAIKNLDIRLCDKINDESIKDICKDMVEMEKSE